MTDIIDFLERMGRDAGLRGATRAELAALCRSEFRSSGGGSLDPVLILR